MERFASKAIVLLIVLVMVVTITACSAKEQPQQASGPIQTTYVTEPHQTSSPLVTTAPPQTTDAPEISLTPNDFGSFDGKITAYATPINYYPNDGDFGKAQGSCTDGTYIYLIIENTNVSEPGGYSENSHYSKIVKIDSATMETVMISEPLLIDHGNDVAYNSKTGMLVVSHNTPNYKSLSFVNPETLELVKTIEDNELAMYGIDYNAKLDKYVVGISGGYNFAILDSDLHLEQIFTGKNTFATKQGITCDDSYIYFLQYKDNLIVIYDWDGNFVRKISVRGVPSEPEGIFIINGTFYISAYYGGNAGTQLYVVSFEAD